jgi:hypothetical protein
MGTRAISIAPAPYLLAQQQVSKLRLTSTAVRPCVRFATIRAVTNVAGPTESESKSTITVLQEVRSPVIPDDAYLMTVLINHPPGAPG